MMMNATEPCLIKEDMARARIIGKNEVPTKRRMHTPAHSEPEPQDAHDSDCDFNAQILEEVQPLPSPSSDSPPPPVVPGAYSADATGTEQRVSKLRFSLLASTTSSSGDPPIGRQAGSTGTDAGTGTIVIDDTTSVTTDEASAFGGLTVANPVRDDCTLNLPKAEEYDPEHATNANQTPTKAKEEGVASRKPCVFLWVLAVVLVGAIVLVVSLRNSAPSAGTATEASLTLAPTTIVAESTQDRLLNLLPEESVSLIIQGTNNSTSTTPQAMAYDWLVDDPLVTNYSDVRLVQRFALSTLYFATSGHDWINNTDWLSYNHHECDWYMRPSFALKEYLSQVYPGYLREFEPDEPCFPSGVYKNLWLDQNGLQGSLPLELYLLTSLRTLSAGLNTGLVGSISSHIGHMSNLEGFAIFRMQNAGTIPTEIGLLTNLKGIGLYGNGHQGTIPTEVNQLTNLQTFTMNGNPQLRGTIPSNIGDFTKLRWIHMEDCDLSGTIPSQFGQLTSLEWLIMGDNSLTGTIPSELGLAKGIEMISTYRNNLSGTLPSELGELTRAFLLSFRGNPQLTGSIPTEFGHLTNMIALNLQESGFTGAIPTELGNLVHLQELTLLDNHFSGAIPSEFGHLTVIERLSLGNNSLTGTIPNNLTALQSSGILYSLNLGNNNLSGTIPEALCNVNATCIEDSMMPCVGVPGLTFDCSDVLCGCNDCPCL